jgi:ankyrin repeat protein
MGKQKVNQLKTFSTLFTAYPHVFDVNCTVDALRNGNQCSALLLACRDDNIDLLKVLVEHGVNLDVEDV